MSTIKASKFQHPDSPDPNLETNADGSIHANKLDVDEITTSSLRHPDSINPGLSMMGNGDVHMNGNLVVNNTVSFTEIDTVKTASIQNPNSQSASISIGSDGGVGILSNMSATGDVDISGRLSAGYLDDGIATTQLYNFSGTIRFTTCGKTGPIGPSLSDAVSSYSLEPFASEWLEVDGRFEVVGGVQYFKIPKTGQYQIRAAGSRSGDSNWGGLGIDITSTAEFRAGEIIRIVVGQKGQGNSATYAGGGGASALAVRRMDLWVPILIAGGGAGQSNNSPNSFNANRNAFAPDVRSGDNFGGRGSYYSTSYSTSIGHNWPGGGGGGWSSDGYDGRINYFGSGQPIGGRALSSESPMGGRYFIDPNNTYDGGFGGGGATGVGGGAAGGGGGWWGGNSSYAGIGASSDDTSHLGGGSYSRNSTYTVEGTNNDQGFVEITLT